MCANPCLLFKAPRCWGSQRTDVRRAFLVDTPEREVRCVTARSQCNAVQISNNHLPLNSRAKLVVFDREFLKALYSWSFRRQPWRRRTPVRGRHRKRSHLPCWKGDRVLLEVLPSRSTPLIVTRDISSKLSQLRVLRLPTMPDGASTVDLLQLSRPRGVDTAGDEFGSYFDQKFIPLAMESVTAMSQIGK